MVAKIFDIGWKAVERDVKMPWDLEGKPLQIKTDSTLGSSEVIAVDMYKESSLISTFTLQFVSTVKYYIGYCQSQIDLPEQPPDEVDKIWTIAKTDTALIITCNGVEVLNYLFADSSGSACAPKWGGDVVEQIITNGAAADFYRAGKTCR